MSLSTRSPHDRRSLYLGALGFYSRESSSGPPSDLRTCATASAHERVVMPPEMRGLGHWMPISFLTISA